jgi:hypothetical protein
VAAKEVGSDCDVKAAHPVCRDIKPKSTEILTQTATAPQLESHSVPNPNAHVFVIADGSERAATQDGSEAATEVCHELENK